jgi:hypothetical protein
MAMRCPKCKFISFDDLSNCAKCANDLSALGSELDGTCKETHLGFFLRSVIQSQNIEEKEFSDSQALPPIDQEDINFDDTSTGKLAAFSKNAEQAQNIDLDDIDDVNRDDDISIELGDIMPIDLDQLDLTSVMSGEFTDTLASNNKQDDVPTTAAVSEDDIDLNLTAEFANDNLDLEPKESFPDIDLDDTTLAAGDDTTVIHASPVHASDDVVLTANNVSFSAEELDSQFDLDDELVAELSDSTTDFDTTATLSKSPGHEAIKFSSTGEFATDESAFGKDDTELNTLDFSDIDVSDLVSAPESQIAGESGALSELSDRVDQGNPAVADLHIHTDAMEADSNAENITFTDIDELDLDDLDESDLATLDDTDDLENDNGNHLFNAEESLSLDMVSEGNFEEYKSDEELPEAELFLDDEEDDIPPDLPT